jgi:hypothetical protein
MLTSTLLYLIGSESSRHLGTVTYKLNLKNHIYSYNIYTLILIGRYIVKGLRNQFVSAGSLRFKINYLGCGA